MRRLLPALLLVLVLAVAACGDDDADSGDAGSTGGETAAQTEAAETATAEEAADGCEQVEAPAPREDADVDEPTEELDASKTYTVTFETTCGTMEIELDVKRAPKTAASFAHLVEEKFYDGLTFHRIISHFVVQGGDPLGVGQGDPGYKVTEAPPEDLRYVRGVVAMAKGEQEPAGTSGSQFFIVTGDSTPLPPDYALVGKLTKGEDVLDKIRTVQTDPQTDMPVAPIVMKRVTLAAE